MLINNKMFGGARSNFPLGDITTAIEFFDKVQLSLIVAHGNTSNEVFVVPENTYILNIVPSGTLCPSKLFDIDNLTFGGNPMRTTIFNLIRDQIFLKTLMYNPNNTNNINSPQKTIAISEPGDIVQNSNLSFKNDNYPIFLLGVYNLPIPIKIQEKINIKNEKRFPEDPDDDISPIQYYIEKQEQILENQIPKLSEEEISKFLEIKIAEKSKLDENDDKIFDVSENFLQNEMYVNNNRKTTVSKLLHTLPGLQTGKIRFIIVNTCRGDVDKNPAKARRFSLISRQRSGMVERKTGLVPISRLNLPYLTNLCNAINKIKSADHPIIIECNNIIERLISNQIVNRDEIVNFLNNVNMKFPETLQLRSKTFLTKYSATINPYGSVTSGTIIPAFTATAPNIVISTPNSSIGGSKKSKRQRSRKNCRRNRSVKARKY